MSLYHSCFGVYRQKPDHPIYLSSTARQSRFVSGGADWTYRMKLLREDIADLNNLKIQQLLLTNRVNVLSYIEELRFDHYPLDAFHSRGNRVLHEWGYAGVKFPVEGDHAIMYVFRQEDVSEEKLIWRGGKKQ